jgi:hypothetical protein
MATKLKYIHLKEIGKWMTKKGLKIQLSTKRQKI